MNLLDYVLIGVVSLSMLFAFWRGFMREFVSLAGLIAAFLIASQFSRPASEFLLPWLQNRTISDIAGFGLIFIGVLFLSGVAGVVVRKLLPAGFTATDRLLGLLFGMLRGILYVGLFFLIYTSYAEPDRPWLEKSLLAPYAIQLGDLIGSVIPPGYPFSRQEMGPSHPAPENGGPDSGEGEQKAKFLKRAEALI